MSVTFKKFKLKKRYVIAIAVAGFCIFILIGAKQRADMRKAQSADSKKEVQVISKSEKYRIDRKELDRVIEQADSLPSENNSVKSDVHSRESVDTMLSNNKEIDESEKEYKSFTIGGSGDAVAPAIVAGNLDRYRSYALVQLPDAQVVDFIDKSVFGQTLAQLSVPIQGGNTQYVFYGCTDTLELKNQLDKYKYINVVGNAEDMCVTDITLEDGSTCKNALVVLGTFTRIYK